MKLLLDWLDLNQDDHVLDLFCGMGNFTLPLARRVKSAVGIEGVFDMVQKAQANAHFNHIDNVKFYQADLTKFFQNSLGQNNISIKFFSTRLVAVRLLH